MNEDTDEEETQLNQAIFKPAQEQKPQESFKMIVNNIKNNVSLGKRLHEAA